MTAVPVEPAGEAAAAALLGAAFADDPLVAWMYPDAAARPDRFARLMARLMRVTRGANRVLRTAEPGACAIWTPPGVRPVPFLAQLRMIPEVPRFGRPVRTLALLWALDRLHPKIPHWYLFVVGSDPAQRGRGHGKAVIEPVLAECDVAGLPAYLESSNPDNVSYYERLGFAVTGEISRAGSPPMIPMWRDPAR